MCSFIIISSNYEIRSFAFNIDGEVIIPTKDKEETKVETSQVSSDICTYSYGIRTCIKGETLKHSDNFFIAPSTFEENIAYQDG